MKADLPLKALSGTAPEYDRPWVETPAADPLGDVAQIDPMDGLKMLISSANYAAKQWVYEQYDSQVMADSLRTPGMGSGIVRVHGTQKALAFTSDVTPRYVAANPFEGGKQAVAEAYRNLSAVGALPLATTDNLNFGNPEKPEIMGQFVGALQRALAPLSPLLICRSSPAMCRCIMRPTGPAFCRRQPSVRVGLIADADDAITGLAREGHMAILIGETIGHLGQSALLAEVFNRVEGDAPPVDLEAEKKHGEFIRANCAWITACSDLSDGGLALAAFEMAEAANIGVSLDAEGTAELFGEDQARYLVACNFDQAEALLAAAGNLGVPATCVGRFGGTQVSFGAQQAELSELSTIFRNSFANAVT